jgi:hypothetical protein
MTRQRDPSAAYPRWRDAVEFLWRRTMKFVLKVSIPAILRHSNASAMGLLVRLLW